MATETIDIENLSDEELLFLVEEIDSLHVAEDSLLRKVASQYFGSNNTMDFIRVGMLILPIIAKRMKHYSPHIDK